jgi:hypothetical protein
VPKDFILDPDVTSLQSAILERIKYILITAVLYLVLRTIAELLAHVLVGEHHFQAGNEGEILEGGARTALGVVSGSRAVRAFIQVSVRADEAAAQILAAVVLYRCHTREERDFRLQLAEGGEITELWKRALQLLVRTRTKINRNLRIMRAN